MHTVRCTVYVRHKDVWNMQKTLESLQMFVKKDCIFNCCLLYYIIPISLHSSHPNSKEYAAIAIEWCIVEKDILRPMQNLEKKKLTIICLISRVFCCIAAMQKEPIRKKYSAIYGEIMRGVFIQHRKHRLLAKSTSFVKIS